ncbi:hypothetical protein FLK61_38480 [Paenalkalicoccus suaedae]|uniref:DUF3221 domain-containing protein n=1 Tax=Paenalkalicoccus suaedae TaxID=2592382 RepID=A0A859FHG1_9BACI|nr:hypothetical protein [Paenalkalicoccus suaedae]QKS72511.1 hypothetical protein FLK61_38480 [Paenalkalicoccus suaedae]
MYKTLLFIVMLSLFSACGDNDSNNYNTVMLNNSEEENNNEINGSNTITGTYLGISENKLTIDISDYLDDLAESEGAERTSTQIIIYIEYSNDIDLIDLNSEKLNVNDLHLGDTVYFDTNETLQDSILIDTNRITVDR